MTENFNKKRVISGYLLTLASRVLDYLNLEIGPIKKAHTNNYEDVIIRLKPIIVTEVSAFQFIFLTTS